MSTTSLSEIPVAADMLGKRFGKTVALHDLSLEIPSGRIVGLLGRNGAGKTTLLNLLAGLQLPSDGWCRIFGRDTGELDSSELRRLGFVQQEARFIEWMTVAQHLDFNASFYPSWDASLEKRLIEMLELDPSRKVAALSTGDRQKVSILLGVCHRPSLLLLDEPMSALDPIIRARLLDLLVERLRDDNCTIVISSHILADVEKIIDWVVCLNQGAITEDCAFDTLQECFSEVTLTALNGSQLPSSFTEPEVLQCESNGRQARLVVRSEDPGFIEGLCSAHHAEAQRRPLNLGDMFPHLTRSTHR